MDKKLIDSAWACLPREFKEEVKNQFRRLARIWGSHNESKRILLIKIFGLHNLTSDAEGEEMLMVKAKTVREMYAANDRLKASFPGTIAEADADKINHILRHLFGSKCLPDEPASKPASEEPKPAEPKYHIGQYVRHKPTRLVDVIDGISQTAPYIYHFKHMVNPINGQGIFESDLEPYTEPEGKLGMDARGWFRIDTDAIGNKIKVRIPSRVTEPYTEPKDEVVKMKPIKSKVSVYLATKEEDEEFRTLLHENGFMWNSGNALTSLSNWDSDHKDYQIHFVYPDKTVTFLGKRTEETLTFTEFKKRYFGEDVKVSKDSANCDKQFDNILKDSFRDHNRLHIAAMAMQGILSNADRMNQYGEIAMRESDSLTALVARNALRYADALLEVAEQK